MLQRIVLRDPAIAQWLIFSDPVDVLRLIELMRTRVFEQCGVELETEIEIW